MSDNILNSSAELRAAVEQMSATGAGITDDNNDHNDHNEDNSLSISSATLTVQAPENNTEKVEDNDEDMDEYLARFDKIQAQNDAGNAIISELKLAAHDQARVETLCKYVVHLQQQCDEMYSLLINMNNIFGK